MILTLYIMFVFLQNNLGKWYYKSKRQPTMHEGYMFPLLVSKELDNWPEMNLRKRKWVSVYNLLNFHNSFHHPNYNILIMLFRNFTENNSQIQFLQSQL
jgi:hypothetical protein